jgi:PAS domain S-box-containing protein
MLQYQAKHKKSQTLLFQSSCFFAVALLFFMTGLIRYQYEKKVQRDLLTNKLFDAKTELEAQFKAYENICIEWSAQDEIADYNTFNSLAKKAQLRFPAITALGIAPKGILKSTVPENESMIGFNYLTSNLNPLLYLDAKNAIKTKRLLFAHPINYTKNKNVLVGFYPVFIKENFWGFITLKLNLESFLKLPTLEKTKGSSCHLLLSKNNAVTNQTDYFLAKNIPLNIDDFLKTPVFNQYWNLNIVDTNKLTILEACLFDLMLLTLLAFMALVWIFSKFRKVNNNVNTLQLRNTTNRRFSRKNAANEQQTQEKETQKEEKPIEINPITNTDEALQGNPEKTWLAQENKIVEKNNNDAVTRFFSDEKFLSVIIDQAAIGILKVAYPSLQIKLVNQYFATMLGYEVEELLEITTPELSVQIDNDYRVSDFNKLIKGEISTFDMEKRYVHKNGEPIWCHVTISGIVNQDTDFDSYVVIVKNINEIKKNEKINELHEKRFESLFKDAPIPMLEQDFSEVKNYLDTLKLPTHNILLLTNYFSTHEKVIYECLSRLKIIGINNALMKLLQVDDKITLQKQLYAFLLPESKNTFVKQLMTIALNKKTFKAQTILKIPNNTEKNIEINWKVMRGYEHNYERVLITTEDITERVQNEYKMKKSEERILSLVNNIEGVVWERTEDRFTFSYLSDKIQTILGFDKKSWMKNKELWKMAIYEKDREETIKQYYDKTFNQSSFILEYRIMTQNGNLIWVREYINVLKPNGYIETIRGIMIDITKLKTTEKDLNETLDVVMDQNKRLLNFSHIVSHNLRSHISNILAINHLLEHTNSVEEKEEYFLLIKNITQELNFTLANLNDLTNREAGFNSVKDEVIVHDYVENTISNLHNLISKKQAKIFNKIPTSVSIYFNKSYLENVLTHLLTNALQFSHPEREPIIHLTHFQDENEHVFKITDNGLGIELKENKEKVFQMKRVFHKHLSNQGLGLFISKTQIETMGGKIDLESQVNEGTTMIIKMPI